MFGWLAQLYPGYQESKRTLQISLWAGLIIAAILFWGKPFGLDAYGIALRLPMAASYGLVTTLMCLVFIWWLPRVVPTWYDERRWTVGKEIAYVIWLLFCIAMANMVVNQWWNNVPFTWLNFQLMAGYTVLLGILPVTTSILLKQQALLRKYKAEALQLNAWVEQKGNHMEVATLSFQPEPPSSIILTGDNQGEAFTLLPAQWLAAEASDNYCKIYYLAQGQLQEKLYRTTLKKLEAQLTAVPGLYRCHRSFLVNLDHVSHLSGNAQGYCLHLSNHQLEVPVSRSLNAELKARFS